MNLETQLKGVLGDKAGREIRLTKEEYSQLQHEYCQALARILWADKGLVDSLGHTWNMVMDPRFSRCEAAWFRTIKITASANKGQVVQGLTVVDDQGQISGSGQLMGLEQYSEMLAEGRHFLSVVRGRGVDPHEVKDWSHPALMRLIQGECPNYFNRAGKQNKLVDTFLKMFQHDWLGLLADYSEVSNIDQWVTVADGEPVQGGLVLDHETTPVVQGEVEYLDRALNYRTVLKANLIKILVKLGGAKLEKAFTGVIFTEVEKDMLLKECLKLDYDKLYHALPIVLGLVKRAQETPYETRLQREISYLQKEAQASVEEILSGKRVPLDLLDGDEPAEGDQSDLIMSCANFVNSTPKMTLYYLYQQAIHFTNAGQPGFKAVVDFVEPYLDPAVAISDEEFEAVLAKAKIMENQAWESDKVEAVEQNRDALTQIENSLPQASPTEGEAADEIIPTSEQ